MKDHLTPDSQQLRKNATREENTLWFRYLRTYPVRFRRQHPIGPYIVDFYCAQAKLVLELDGSQHYDPEGQRYDAERTRFWNPGGFWCCAFPTRRSTASFGACARPLTWP